MGDTAILILKNEKDTKIGLVPILGQEKLLDLFLLFSGQLKTRPKVFHSYFLLIRNEEINTKLKKLGV